MFYTEVHLPRVRVFKQETATAIGHLVPSRSIEPDGLPSMRTSTSFITQVDFGDYIESIRIYTNKKISPVFGG
jgi:hypothetical protein